MHNILRLAIFDSCQVCILYKYMYSMCNDVIIWWSSHKTEYIRNCEEWLEIVGICLNIEEWPEVVGICLNCEEWLEVVRICLNCEEWLEVARICLNCEEWPEVVRICQERSEVAKAYSMRDCLNLSESAGIRLGCGRNCPYLLGSPRSLLRICQNLLKSVRSCPNLPLAAEIRLFRLDLSGCQ
jgi:hypothetical protein